MEKIKANPNCKDLPVIVLSNLGQKVQVKKALELGATDYIVKAHFTPGEIIKKVKEQILQSQKKK